MSRSIRTASRPVIALAVLLSGLVMAGPAWSQDAAAGAVPTLADAVKAANDQLSANPSPWRPCQGAAQLSLDDDGYMEITTERSGYCADSRQRLHIADLDEALVSVEIDVEGTVVVGCKAGKDCVRHFRRRKSRAGDGSWERRDDRWIPDGPATMPHLAGEARIEFLSDPRVASQIVAALKFVARTADANAESLEPDDPFEGRVAKLDGGTAE